MTPEMLERLREARAQGGFGGRGGRGARQGERQTRRAAVFVVDEAGNIEPRMIEIGLSDWDNAQVVSGLEEGERLAIVGGAQLLQAQQESLDRMRNRMGGGDPFGGGGGRRR